MKMNTIQRNEINEENLAIQFVDFGKHEITITFWSADLKVCCREYGQGFRWYLIHPDGYEELISRARLDEIFKHYNFVDGIKLLWRQSYENADRVLDKHKSRMEDEEKKLGKKFHRIINKILEHSLETTEIPHSIKDIPNIKKLNAGYAEAIIYFLLHNDKIVYVGQTKSEWPGRIRQHLKDQKLFDQVYYIHVREHEVDRQEQYYIKKFKPKYNKAHN